MALESYLDTLASYQESYGLLVDTRALQLCLDHLSLVLEKNRVMNLTRITDVEDALVLHILDSLLFIPALHDAPDGPCLDMGTGAGYPGIPLAVSCPDRSFMLLDSVGKKISVVHEFAEILGLAHVCCVHDRIESYARSHARHFSAVVARAVASLPVLLEYATPLLQHEGHLIVSKGRLSEDEFMQGEHAASLCGLSLVSRRDVELPHHMGSRVILSYCVVSEPSLKLPRQVGMAKKHPLGENL